MKVAFKMRFPVAVVVGMLLIVNPGNSFGQSEGVPLPVSEAPRRTIDLKGLSDEAFRKNPALRAKKHEYEGARAKVVNAWLPDDPMIGVDAEGQPDLFRIGNRTDNEYMIQQTIPFPTKLFLKAMLATKEADMAYQRYREEERKLLWHMEQPYYELFLAKKEAQIFEDNKVLLTQLIKSARSRYESAQGNQGDLLKAQIESSKTDIEIFNQKEKIHVAEAHFAHILNQPLAMHYDLNPEIKRNKFQWDITTLENLALQKRPELRAVSLMAEEAGMSRDLYKQSWLPDITLQYKGRQFKDEDSISQNDTFVGVTVPVWSLIRGIGGGWHAAEMDAQAAQASYEAFKNEVLLKIHESFSKVRSAENALDTYENMILPQAKQQVEVFLSSYEAGKSEFLTVIDAERTLRDSQMEYYKSLAEYEMALSDLRLAVGDNLDQTLNKIGGSSK